MKRLVRLVARLYPRSWRERYGAEFEALLDDAFMDKLMADGRSVIDVFAGAVIMQVQRWKSFGPVVLIATVALFAGSWWAGQRPYISPGSHLVFRQDSTLGALVGCLVALAAAIGALIGAILYQDGKRRAAGRLGWATAASFFLYVAAVAVVALLTPRTIVNIGDGYCYDLWCIGVQQVSAAAHGANVLVKVDVRIFSDANRVPAHERNLLYACDERGRRFPLLPDSSSSPVGDITVKPGESVNTALTFLAPADARKLYLTGERLEMPWVYLYFGSDVSPFHRRTFLRVL